MTLPSRRTGTHSTRTRSLTTDRWISPSMISPLRYDRATSGRSSSPRRVPTQSPRYTVWPVVGRTWARTTNSPPPKSPTGAKSNRSEKQKSASRPHDAARRCSCCASGPSRGVSVRASSTREAISGRRGRSSPDLLAEAHEAGQVVDVAVEVRDGGQHVGVPTRARRAARPHGWPPPGSSGSSGRSRPPPGPPSPGHRARRAPPRRPPDRRRAGWRRRRLPDRAGTSGSTLLSTTAPRWKRRSSSADMKNSASRSGADSSVLTTRRWSAGPPGCAGPRGPARRSRRTSSGTARRTRRCPPGTRSRGCGRRPCRTAWTPCSPGGTGTARSASAAAGDEKKSAMRSGASRKSMALRVGGVSTMIRS